MIRKLYSIVEFLFFLQVDIDGKQKISIKDNFKLGDQVLNIDFNGQPFTIQVWRINLINKKYFI